MWRGGLLRFRGYWREYYTKMKKDTSCPFPLCGEQDTINHAMQCKFMNAKPDPWIPGVSEDERMLKYILALNRERRWYQRPII